VVPFDEAPLVGAGDDANAFLALVDVARDGVVDVAFAQLFDVVEERVKTGDDLEERQGEIVLADVLVAAPGIRFKHRRIEGGDSGRGVFFCCYSFGHIICLS
jgi:hypothetical protein